MKTVILAGGKGTRLSDGVDSIPKPMVRVGGLPILCHILNIYSSYGFNDFILALGYKSEYIKQYFLNFLYLNNDFRLDFGNNKTQILSNKKFNWNIEFIDTGTETQTGGRLLNIREYLHDETFMLTYGDGLADINLNNLIKFHKNHTKMVTITAVRPSARFGELNLDANNTVTSFKEKPQIKDGWVNGGFFVLNKEFLNYIDDESTILEKEPLEQMVAQKDIAAYRHEGFWQCMDTIRDKDYLNQLWDTKKAFWVQNND